MYDTTKPNSSIIIDLVKRTWETPYVSVNDWVVTKKFNHAEFHHVDGIGTKGVYHWERKTLENAVVDAWCMNTNDLAMKLATPYAVIDHVFLPEEGCEVEIIEHLVNQCLANNVAITGGETAVHNNMQGMDISISMLGFMKEPQKNQFKLGDYVIGLGSNSPHSNGYTRLRKEFGDEFREDFVKPTINYLNPILELHESGVVINALQHVTGGAFTKPKGLLPDCCNLYITNEHKLKPQDVYYELHSMGVSEEDLYKTFNNGVGFILSVSKDFVEEALTFLKKSVKADIIGRVTSGNKRIMIESQYSNKIIFY